MNKEKQENKYIAQEGDYCKRNFVIIEKHREKIIPCDICDVRCVFSKLKEDKNYLIRK